MDKGYSFDSHATQVSATVRSKVEKMSKVVKLLDFKHKKRVTESIIVSTLSYCLAVWGFRKKTRTRCQKAFNTAIRMVLDMDSMDSISDGLATLGWLNMDNLWRLEQISALRRVCTDHVPMMIYEILTRHTQNRYLIRADGLRSSWWPRNTHGEHAFVHLAVDVYNALRVGQRSWFHTRENRMMTKSEVRRELSNDLISHFGNSNLY